MILQYNCKERLDCIGRSIHYCVAAAMKEAEEESNKRGIEITVIFTFNGIKPIFL